MTHTSDHPAGADCIGNASPERLSRLLIRLAGQEREFVTIGQLARVLRDRGFGAVLIILCAPNLVPLPPGTTTILGIPILLVAVQLIVGYRRPLLPRTIRKRQISKKSLDAAIAKLLPWIERFERFASPRLWYLPQRLAEQLIGIVAAVMALILMLPIPFANSPPAAAIILLSLGLGERDGAWTGAGFAVALISLGIAIGLAGTAGLAIARAF